MKKDLLLFLPIAFSAIIQSRTVSDSRAFLNPGAVKGAIDTTHNSKDLSVTKASTNKTIRFSF